MTGFCKTYVPKEIMKTLEGIKDNDEAVKNFGIDLGTKMCKRMLEFGTPGLHMYTLNTERSAVTILENLGLINKSQVGPTSSMVQQVSIHGCVMQVRHAACALHHCQAVLRLYLYLHHMFIEQKCILEVARSIPACLQLTCSEACIRFHTMASCVYCHQPR